jgi:hypothetical protein
MSKKVFEAQLDTLKRVSMMRAELQCLLTENMKLKEKIQHSFSLESLRNDEDKAKHYTGLNYSTLMALFENLSPHIPETSLSEPHQTFHFVMTVNPTMLVQS